MPDASPGHGFQASVQRIKTQESPAWFRLSTACLRSDLEDETRQDRCSFHLHFQSLYGTSGASLEASQARVLLSISFWSTFHPLRPPFTCAYEMEG